MPACDDPFDADFQFRHLPLRNAKVGPTTDLGPAGHLCEVTGTVGEIAVRYEVLLSRMSGGNWYFAEPADPPCLWLGRSWAGKA